MIEIIIFEILTLYIFKYRMLGFRFDIPFKELKLELGLVPFHKDEVYFRLVKKCSCCDLFMFDLVIPFIINISITYYLGE